MKAKSLLVAVFSAVLSIALIALPQAASASYVDAGTFTYSFSPALGPALVNGTVTFTPGTVFRVNTTPLAAGFVAPGQTVANYFGSCAVATISGWDVGVLIGGSVFVGTNVTQDSVGVAVPILPCLESSAIGAYVFAQA